jgi:hypothetical protein
MEISDNVRRLWRLEMMGMLALATGLATACPERIVTSNGTYHNLKVAAQSQSDGSHKRVIINYREIQDSRFIVQYASGEDRNNNGAFDPDEIEIGNMPLKEATRLQETGARDFQPIMQYSNPADLMAAYQSAMQQGTQAKRR